MTISASHQLIFNLLPDSAKVDLQILDWKNGVSLICMNKGVFKQKNSSSLNLENYSAFVTTSICNAIKSLRTINSVFEDFPFCVRRLSFNRAPGLYIYLGTNNIEKHNKEALALYKANQLNQKLNSAAKEMDIPNDNS